MRRTVHIGEMEVSTRRSDELVAFSLGSCVGLTLYDPIAVVGGLVHCMLPRSKADPERARANPCLYTDTGVTALLQAVFNRGARRDRLIAKVAGAAVFCPGPSGEDLFRVGDRNYNVLRKILWKNDILIAAESIGGRIPRTMALHMSSGTTTIRSRGAEEVMGLRR